MLRPQRYGCYFLLDRIAFGGTAEVYRAKVVSPDRDIALRLGVNTEFVAAKRLLRYLAHDKTLVKMLTAEARLASRLRHPNIATIYDLIRCRKEHLIIMEHVDGQDLLSIIARHRMHGLPLGLGMSLYVVRAVLEALHAAHEQCGADGRHLEIIHRDVSPSNVLVSYRGDVKLCDFGIAKAVTSQLQTQRGIIKGKLQYMSPEQATSSPLDRRSDVFSAGSMLYELITGRPAFSGDNDLEVLSRVRDARFARPSYYVPDLPPELEQTLSRAMAASPEARFPSAAAFSQALQSCAISLAQNYRGEHLSRMMRRLFADDLRRSNKRLKAFLANLSSADEGSRGDDRACTSTDDDRRLVHQITTKNLSATGRLPRTSFYRRKTRVL